jgi:hypothetical protein
MAKAKRINDEKDFYDNPAMTTLCELAANFKPCCRNFIEKTVVALCWGFGGIEAPLRLDLGIAKLRVWSGGKLPSQM